MANIGAKMHMRTKTVTISTLTDSKGNLLAVSDKVRDEEGLTWFVLSMFPEINSVVGITTNEDRFDRKAFRPEELEII
tara:strand:- start:347 stop:580 length:234 start_codon:yes stop_codon:yes gene_type:complete